MEAPVRHVFVCTNRRKVPLSCGLRVDAPAVAAKLRQQAALVPAAREAAGDAPGGAVHVAETRCLGRCPNGPVIAVHPDKIWYSYASEQDLAEIVEEHLVNGRVVERLALNSWSTATTARQQEQPCP